MGAQCKWPADWEVSFSLLPVPYMLVFVLGLSGNGLVIFTVWRGPRAKRRSANTYIGNLALADLAFVVTLLWATYMALRFHWPFGSALCKLSSYLVLLHMFTSAFCLDCLNFEHYLAIVLMQILEDSTEDWRPAYRNPYFSSLSGCNTQHNIWDSRIAKNLMFQRPSILKT
ncbi:hypothetical protein KIL84_012486 [Mauremys mutica]|uniref:G-protein coupled receptors family 1 profile domain-containing protein n=1 Tax=Mauremys mutica TaxID=74926 RepID=A0A9D4B8M7_9SAUR|nr:hypothetical protein KIL84_012486 [Mauremys mutica]